MRGFLDRLRPFAPLLLRLALAGLFVAYGARLIIRELPGMETAVIGWGLPKWIAKAGAWTLLAGGALIGIGFTRLAAFACAFVTAFLLWKTKLQAGWQGGLDLPVLALAGCLSLLLSGAGRLSLDRRFFGGS